MSERAKVATKRPEAKKENSVSQTKKTNFSKPTNSPVDHILFLQRTVGNQAVQGLLKSGVIQARLTIGQPGDIYEQEADRVAEQVMRMPDLSKALSKRVSKNNKFPSIQRTCTECEGELHRQPMEEKEEETLQTKEAPGGTPEVTFDVQERVNAMRGGGQPLPESVRAFFKPRFGYDFSQVRLHTDSQASESAQAVNALAYTVGQDVVFGAGQYSPETESGKKLLAHELTHVLQQSNEESVIRRKIQFDSPNYIRENPIERILSGQPAGGVTTPTVNSNQPVDFRQAGELFFKAIEPKETSYKPSTKECTFKDFDVKVSANVIIFTEPEGNKWTMNFPGSDIKGISACHDKGDVPVVMTGKPSSEAAGKWIEKNEQEHVDDLKKLYDKYLQPHFKWLLSLKGKGDDDKKCHENLISALGNKDALVVRDFLKDWAESIKERDEGGKHTLKNDIKIKDNCSRVEIESSKK